MTQFFMGAALWALRRFLREQQAHWFALSVETKRVPVARLMVFSAIIGGLKSLSAFQQRWKTVDHWKKLEKQHGDSWYNIERITQLNEFET
jgi:hypothetical protein